MVPNVMGPHSLGQIYHAALDAQDWGSPAFIKMLDKAVDTAPPPSSLTFHVI